MRKPQFAYSSALLSKGCLKILAQDGTNCKSSTGVYPLQFIKQRTSGSLLCGSGSSVRGSAVTSRGGVVGVEGGSGGRGNMYTDG